MYYLLKLEVNYKIPKGAIVSSSNKVKLHTLGTFLMEFDPTEIEHSFAGILWDGKKVFNELSERYNLGDAIETDIYDIAYTIMSIGDDWEISDEVQIEDLLEDDLMEQWDDLNKPIVFLMDIHGVPTWTDCGEEWDIENFSVKVVTHDDLERMAE